MCLSAAYWSQIHSIYFAASSATSAQFGFSDEFIYKEIARKHEDRELATHIIPDETSLAPFQEWAKSS